MKSSLVRPLEMLGEPTPRFADSHQHLIKRDLHPALQLALCRRRYRHTNPHQSHPILRGLL
ncbi:MAG: hypothetical protein P3X24_000655 [bacterium]|nr:hypothetical protein [bacterium]